MRRELPAGAAHFVNRDDEREKASRAVARWLRERAEGSRPVILALTGHAGLGKTELAWLLARTEAERFPDGVLSVDLEDFRLDGVLDPADVLTQLLRSLGVDAAKGPYRERCRQYWNKTAGARLVLLVDNVRYASEIEPLLPASGRSAVILASHGPLAELEDGAATDLPLPPFGEQAATEMLQRQVSDGRLAADPEAVRALVGLCEGLPAALYVAGRWVRTHRLRPLSRLIPELRAELDRNGVPGAERFWDLAYDGLSDPAALLYRLLPHHPGTTFTPQSATALLGLGQEVCEDALEELHTAGLLDLRAALDSADGRMRLGPLRAHALRRSRRDVEEDQQATLEGAQLRVLRWFVRQAQRADRYAAGQRLLVSDPFPALPHAPDVPLADPAQADDDVARFERAERASAWLFEERHALLACARLAHARGWDAEVVALCEPMWTYALDHPRQPATLQVFQLAVESAVRHGQHASWLVRTRCQLARHLWESGALAQAEEQLEAAEAAARLLGDGTRDHKLAASVIEFQGMLRGAQDKWRDAVDHFVRCREAHRAIPNEYGVLLQTYRLGEAHAELGELAAAHEVLTQAHTTADRLGRARMTARTAYALAGVLCRLGRTDQARPLYDQALRGARERRSGFDLARVHDALAELESVEGRTVEAEHHRAAAHDLRRRDGLA